MAVDGALEGLELSGDKVEEGGLSGSVLSHDGDTRVHATKGRSNQSSSTSMLIAERTYSIPKERSL